MPIKHGLLALLDQGPSHGYQLKTDFEACTGGAWQLNIGQVYTTLQRLERDGLVAPVDGGDDDERRVYRITDGGRAALDGWYATPVVISPPPRDELAIKVLLAANTPGVDPHAVIQRQRTASVEQLQQLTRRKREAHPERDLAQLLHLDALILKTEADVRWLDACDARLRQYPDRLLPGARSRPDTSEPPHAGATDHAGVRPAPGSTGGSS